jgi:acetyltransferase-like isoleucine patch superfamily enzyme
VSIGDSSQLLIGRGTTFDGRLEIGSNCRVVIGDGCFIENVRMIIGEGAEVTIANGALVDGFRHTPAVVIVRGGRLTLGEKAHLQGESQVRFGGHLSIGTHTGIGFGSEIRCEERVEIGSFGMISYGVSIFDTNTHPVDWQVRRERIIAGYPFGTEEPERPSTSPVKIGDDIWIGKGAVITKGTRLGDRCIVGIGTVVPAGDYPPDSTIVSPRPRVLSTDSGE